MGARVLLSERYGFLGGAAANSLVLAYCGFFLKGRLPVPAVGGIGTDLLGQLGAIGQDVAPIMSRSGNWIVMLDPEAVKYARSEEHTPELQSLMRISYAVFCLKKKKTCHDKS